MISQGIVGIAGGILAALAVVFLAPRLQRYFRRRRTMSVTFSPEARTGGEAKYFDTVEQVYVRVAGIRVARVDPPVSPVAKVLVKMLVLLQVGLRRVLELAEADVAEVNAGLLVPHFVTARAVLETSCLLYRLAQEAERISKAHDPSALQKFDEQMMRAMFGGKSREWTHPEEYEAPNVLTIIQTLTKTTMPNLQSMYELLSEYAHPNYDGMMGVYQRVTDGASTLIDHPAVERRGDVNPAVGMTGFGLMVTERAVGRYQAVLPEFVRLCEEDVYARGTWPPNVPYPRRA